jgi:hypothetical protein
MIDTVVGELFFVCLHRGIDDLLGERHVLTGNQHSSSSKSHFLAGLNVRVRSEVPYLI